MLNTDKGGGRCIHMRKCFEYNWPNPPLSPLHHLIALILSLLVVPTSDRQTNNFSYSTSCFHIYKNGNPMSLPPPLFSPFPLAPSTPPPTTPIVYLVHQRKFCEKIFIDLCIWIDKFLLGSVVMNIKSMVFYNMWKNNF